MQSESVAWQRIRAIALLSALLSLAVSAFYSVRLGAILLALALAMYSAPGFKSHRRIEQVAQALMVVSLITLALALPRR